MSEITRKTKTIGPIITNEGKLKSSDRDMAKAFNDFLCDLMKPSSKVETGKPPMNPRKSNYILTESQAVN